MKAIDTATSIGSSQAEKGFGVANFNLVKLLLAQHAADKTVVNTDVKHREVVISAHISRMLDAYELASGGGVWVVCAPADSGKTCAAEYVMLGDHEFRPERSLMVSAVAMKNFPQQFAEDTLDCKKAGKFLSQLLCQALATDPGSMKAQFAKAGKVAAMASCKASDAVPFDKNSSLTSYGPNETYKGQPVATFQRLPVLILDNFNEDTEANSDFVKTLLQTATDHQVVVFIMTKDEAWASKMVKMNGGTKIKPLYGNVGNEDYAEDGSFSGEPDWKVSHWSVDTLRELVRPDCVKYSLDLTEVVPDDATEGTRPMGPRQAKSRVNLILRQQLRGRK